MICIGIKQLVSKTTSRKLDAENLFAEKMSGYEIGPIISHPAEFHDFSIRLSY